MKIAIVGSGISGLYAAHKLQNDYEVTVFDKNDYVGGHTATKTISVPSGRYDIDTGFIVCNNKTYPHFLRFLSELNVGLKETNMSFSVSCASTGLEYNGTTLNQLFAQRRNLLRPRFWKMVREILRFNRIAKETLASEHVTKATTLGEFLAQHHFSDWVVTHYIAPMTAAIWSTPLTDVMHFPLAFFLQFCENHGLLNINDRPQWYVVKGGSHQYVNALLNQLTVDFNLNSPVVALTRHADGVSIRTLDDREHRFDKVIVACHSDEALKLLTDASKTEREILGDIKYEESEVLLHTDVRLLPKRPLAHAAWNYLLTGDNKRPTLTYHMNILQGIDAPETFCVTLNRQDAIAPEKILGKFRYAHPQFTPHAVMAQQRHREISGVNHTYYAGAYWFNGFHEDGVVSARRVLSQLGV